MTGNDLHHSPPFSFAVSFGSVHQLLDPFTGRCGPHPLLVRLPRNFLYRSTGGRLYFPLHRPRPLFLHLHGPVGKIIYSSIQVHLQFCVQLFLCRLFNIQWRALLALGRFFTGKKWNPLRERVDHVDSSVDQLFVGSLIMMVVAFLLPTTVSFYCVFAAVCIQKVA